MNYIWITYDKHNKKHILRILKISISQFFRNLDFLTFNENLKLFKKIEFCWKFLNFLKKKSNFFEQFKSKFLGKFWKFFWKVLNFLKNIEFFWKVLNFFEKIEFFGKFLNISEKFLPLWKNLFEILAFWFFFSILSEKKVRNLR